MHIEDKRTEIINRMLEAARSASPRQDAQPEPAAPPPAEQPGNAPEPVAIIGLSGYLPGSMSVGAFWNALDRDEPLLEEIPAGRFDWDALYDPHGKDPDKIHTKWGGVIPAIRDFDPRFFGILPAEAILMDPRKRLLLMSVYHALEDAGYAPQSLRKSATGVFVAVEEDEYARTVQELGIDTKVGNGNSSSLIANQLSYFFDFRGPSEVINTMCSGAAVAIHRAVRALRSGEISCAVVGAANLLLHPDPFIFLSRTGQMSSTRSVRSFGKGADGFLRADGVGSIILKPLPRAVADGDAIYAVIRNTAVNYNGRSGTSMAAPNVAAHVEVIRACYNEAAIDPRRVGYIEAQGMGNQVADIAEWEACNRALKAMAGERGVALQNGGCRVSTLKPMTGHMHAASAMGALFKIIRSFQTGKIHKIIGLAEINPDLDLEDQPCRLAAATEDWPGEALPRLAGLHSYGSGGNNAHLLLEAYQSPQPAAAPDSAPVIVPCSAETEAQCRTMVQNLVTHLEQRPGDSLASVAYTLQTGRDALKYRVAFVAGTRQALLGQARAYLAGTPAAGTFAGNAAAHPAPAGMGDLAAVAGAWVNGAAIAWDRAAFKHPVTRLHLPGYAFDCREYWVQAGAPKAQPAGAPATVRTTALPAASPAPPDPEKAARSERWAEHVVRDVLRSFLLVPAADIDADQEFSAMGFDSLLVTNLTRQLERQYALKLEPAVFFEHNTPRQLIRFLGDTFGEGLPAHPATAAAGGAAVPVTPASPAVPVPARLPAAGQPRERQEPIAIIGLAGSFPQSPDLDAFWQNIIAGHNCVEEVPGDRWPVEKHFHPDRNTANQAGKSYGKWGGFLRDLYLFDPLFFNISPLEAETMNPKERLFLQCTWHVMEDAGYTPQSLAPEQVGVFVGVTRSGLDPYKVSMFPVANRVSYTFNFRGPSMPVDTACSSSLVAIHEACGHIYAGECTVAIAGGVHAFLDPSHFAALSGLQMLSPDGASRSFGDQANGMVPGEGVGAMLLKPLSRAVADGDSIYGVIRASATNHGGKANGFTVPNPRSHRDLICATLGKAGLSARQVNYVEAHGTGTSLGDPIEIRGLAEAFKRDTPDAQYCPIGSIKSNIGHLEAAAGMSGLAKVLLQMKHKKLAPSLHSKNTNPQINFPNTPFYVQQEAADWAPVDAHGNEVPRIACISSFGAGGSNAHLIVEEYPQAPAPESHVPGVPALVVLSAKGENQLKARARQLAAFLAGLSPDDRLLRDIAYTLQTGREPMDERLAVEVLSLAELRDKLDRFAAGAGPIDKLHAGNARRHKETLALFTGDAAMEKMVAAWLDQADCGRLASLWVKGYPLEWDGLYRPQRAGEDRPRRVGLPGYPFLKEYYGPPVAGPESQPARSAPATLHPLVHQNVSTFSTQQFVSTFTGAEFFLNDHRVHGQKLLPGVAYLEMVHAAVRLAAGPEDGKMGVYLSDVAWVQPVVVAETPVALRIGLHPEQDGTVRFEICSEPGPNDPDAALTHSQGTVQLAGPGPAPVLDLAALRQLTAGASFSADQCYGVFEQMGIAYGPAHRGIEQLRMGQGQVLAKLTLPAALALDPFYLHPSLMDAATQAIMGCLVLSRSDDAEPLPLAVPFALGALNVFGPCTGSMWAYVRPGDGQAPAAGPRDDINNLSFDIDLCDEAGNVCVQMKNFVSRVLPAGSAGKPAGLLYVQPAWEARPADGGAAQVPYQERLVLYAEGLVPAGAGTPGLRLVALQTGSSREEIMIPDCTVQVFREVQKLLQAKPKGKVLVQVLVEAGRTGELLAAVSGLLKTAQMENPQLLGQVIRLESGQTPETIARRLEESSRQPHEQQIAYARGGRTVLTLREYVPANVLAARPWKAAGVYLITGGVGGLGLLFAAEIARQAEGATLVLTGRGPLTGARQEQLRRIGDLGAKVEYEAVDVADEPAVERLVGRVLLTHGRLDGVMHCAGVVHDNFILKKTEEEVRRVLAPKVQGLVHLDRATQRVPLDFFIVFSSVAALTGNLGQGDYAVANAFMDAYAGQRNARVAAGERQGFTLAVNWPLWRQGGMHVDEEIEKIMRDTIGMHPLETAPGIEAFYKMVAAGRPQMMVVQGNLRVLRKTFLGGPPTPSTTPAAGHAPADAGRGAEAPPVAGATKDSAVAYFKQALSGVIKLSPDRVDADAPLEEYGIDSVMVMQMTNSLEKVFGRLPKTLFFEYQDIASLAGYFLETYPEKMAELLGTGPAAEPEKTPPPAAPSSPRAVPIAIRGRQANPFARPGGRPDAPGPGEKALDIAIVGLSGRYPQARNLREFWDNLRQGKNAVTEIPENRWDHSRYFDRDKYKAGKTYTKWGGFLDGVDEFDALFFNISPKEAEVLDPQERLFLQCAYEAVEDAGYTRDTLATDPAAGPGGNVGVFVGVMWEEYHLYAAQETAAGRPMVLSASPASIANRVSYYFNFHGPSLAVDTMCSSSLTSIHLACQSLQKGECEAAIAGGVNVSIHPNKYLVLGWGKYASSKGLCESFGEGGDGYVPGEGVGAVLLKPLAKAIADGDHIYGVIKGTAVNHGGKANGFTVPNPRAQANVISRAMKVAGFDPRTISYEEAHGTGTSLGDPIEFAGLCKAFDTEEKQFCALGSVKSNIGHCESAAGISGLTKVLLQMKYRQLVPSLHSGVLNPNIDFANSPFVVQQELAAWKRPVLTLDGARVEVPRRAGVSSFGAGGANAHVLVEEYIPQQPVLRTPAAPAAGSVAAIVLSARTADRLKELAGQLAAALESEAYAAPDLAPVAYTLQVGREHMEERLALEVASVPELARKLAAFARGETGIEKCYLGKAKTHKGILSFFTSDDDMEKTVESWLRKKKYAKLLGLWANGYDFDWKKLYEASALPARISLPAYPFARSRHWPELGGAPAASHAGPDAAPAMHPLVQRNTSTFAGQQFSSTFNGDEFFLKDHLVHGQKLLPGVAYLEMVNEAMSRAGGHPDAGVRLENVVWAQPLVVNGHPEKVNIRLTPGTNGEVGFEISSPPATADTKLTTHSQGTTRFVEKGNHPVLDLDALKARTDRQVITAEACYALFAGMGIAYGPAQRGIQSLRVGEGQVLARLSLPGVVAHTLDQYCLHPSLLDASLQAVIGLAVKQGASLADAPAAVPFAMQSLAVLGRCTPDMWAFVRHSTGGPGAPEGGSAGQLSFDIDVCDDSGNVCVQIRGFTSRIIKKKAGPAGRTATLLMEPAWQPREIAADAEAVSYAQHLVMVIGNDALAGGLAGQLAGAQVLPLTAAYPSLAAGFETYALQVFGEVKKFFGAKPRSRVLVQVVVPDQGEQQVFAALAGLLKTAQLEDPSFTGQLLRFAPGENAAAVAAKLAENRRAPSGAVVRYRDGRREVLAMRPCAPAAPPARPIWKDGGVYLVTGGAGGLGLLLAGEILRRTEGAAVILTGRSAVTEAMQTQLARLHALGGSVEYRPADVADEGAVAALVQSIGHAYGKLDGVIHCAGVLRDNFILKKPAAEISQVLAPKTKGMDHLDAATRDMPLDFFIVCSSTTGVTGNAGQADYALANAYLDEYARYRNGLVAAGSRRGHTLSVNWPFWKEGGMRLAPAHEKHLLETYGLVPLETAAGLAALYEAMATGAAQVMVLPGEVEKLKAAFAGETTGEKPEKGNPPAPVPPGSPAPRPEVRKELPIKTLALDYFKALLSTAIKLPVTQIAADEPMDEYGIDSVMVMEMTNSLEKVFGSLSKTLFFEYQNIGELTGYFLETYPEKLNALLSPPVETTRVPDAILPVRAEKLPLPDVDPAAAPRAAETGQGRAITPFVPRPAGTAAPAQPAGLPTGALDIAIIGVSGSYPQARDLKTFWQVLREGRNCITEVPPSRWDHSRYYDQDKDAPGKTYGKWGGFLEGVDEFDPLFFNISPKEAQVMDPQERLFLQCVYETIQDAGYTRHTVGYNPESGVAGNVGVYVGVMTEEYQLYGAQETALGRPLALSGNAASIANRVSYFCNFNGPSIALNTMCSSSLTSIHLACQSLLLGECEAAVAGGVNVTVHPNKYLGLAYGKFLSSKGLCESFGNGGDGYVPGEGVGAVLLKPLAKAIADGDHIYGVIKGTAVNHGGKMNGYTVPNPKAQAGVIGKALRTAGFDPGTVSYLEAHGTGTSLGDPIEINGLNRAFKATGPHTCAIGSVKTNIGHCESASGIAGVTKVLLQMKYRQLVPSLHADVLNPNIDFANSPFVVQRELAAWKRPVLAINGERVEVPRRAGVSSFGAGGANAHVLIEEYIPAPADRPGDPSLTVRASAQPPALVVLSAASPAQLRQQAERLLGWMHEAGPLPGQRLADLAYTLQVGREALEERLAVEAWSFGQLEAKLQGFVGGEKGTDGVYLDRVAPQPADSGDAEDRAARRGAWLDQQQYGEVLAHWVKGAPVDWNKLYSGGSPYAYRPQRLSLPAYPFVRKRCWFGPAANGRPPETAAPQKPAAGGQRAQLPPHGVLLKKQWTPAPAAPGASPAHRVAILYTPETAEIAARLQSKLSDALLLDGHEPGVFDAQRLHPIAWKDFGGFVDLTGCGAGQLPPPEWITWLQRLVEHGRKDGLCLLGVTRGLTAFRNAHVNLAGAPYAGLYRMLGSEYSHVVARHVDVEAHTEAGALVQLVLDELAAAGEAPEVCYRGGNRYRPSLVETAPASPAGEGVRFSAGQAVWITGGTRGLGYLCARHLVSRYGVTRLVLTGQEELPARHQWDASLREGSAAAPKIRNLMALEALGAEVKVLSVPLTDGPALRRGLEAVKAEWGAIHGVLHCAGTGDRESPAFIRKSVAGVQTVMAPKVQGLNNLYQCVQAEPLAFFILFSSVSAVIPALGVGQSAYAAANAYMDHFAEAVSGRCPVTSIQWPNWKETGMGEVKSNAYQQTGLLGLTDAEGLHLLDLALRSPLGPVVLPALVDRAAWQPGNLLTPARPAKQATPAPATTAKAAASPAPAAAPLLGAVQAWLTGLFAKELNLEGDELNPNKPFQDYGVDSILITHLLQSIRKTLKQDIDPSILFEYATIASFAAWLVATFAGELPAVFFPPEAPVPTAAAEDRAEQPALPALRPAAVTQPAAGAAGPGPDIAVVGMACRFPGAPDLDAYWQLVAGGSTAIGAVPRDRWNAAGDYAAGLLDNPFHFDPKFFLLAEADAKAIDPQALVVLEETLKLFCHAGYTPEEVKGKPVGVYLGGRSRPAPDHEALRIARNPILAVGQNYLAANVSQFFDLRGPAMVLDTACSSALVGMHMAVQALRNGEIQAAVVGGVNVLHSEETHELFSRRGILSKDEAFHLFDRRAGGIVLGEGAGLVLLKTVDQARRDGDNIYATIKAVAINNDGRTAGPATPNIEAQKEVMRAALARAGKAPGEISYIEVNGSGSEVTDLIELKAISAVYRPSDATPCGLGSVKPNIGHPLCAEGIAGFIKVVLMLHHNQFVPFLSGQQPMKYFDIGASPFSFCRTLGKWPAASRVAALNCFADGGTNAHVIVEAWEPASPAEKPVRMPLAPPVLHRKNLRKPGGLPPRRATADDESPVALHALHQSVWESFQ